MLSNKILRDRRLCLIACHATAWAVPVYTVRLTPAFPFRHHDLPGSLLPQASHSALFLTAFFPTACPSSPSILRISSALHCAASGSSYRTCVAGGGCAASSCAC